MRLKIFEKRDKKISYDSTKTRTFSGQAFMGGAEFNEVNTPPAKLPIDSNENLESKFNSGVCRTDIPRMWGHPSVDRIIGNRRMMLANDIRDWRRQGGEILYKKS